ncbi:hypothetical protein AUJ84_02335 [Candidatus Pacearchaeota archaeon CG1_02_32_132]|nr:MAG: hypothetical protein AUJ84_02335 [Candidatus Pacearchaeota archaeon CG1_02_32_132]
MALGGLFAIVVGLIVFAFWIWMIVDCAQRGFKNNVEKIVWIIVIVLGSWIGALVYFLVIRMYNPRGLAKTSR